MKCAVKTCIKSEAAHAREVEYIARTDGPRAAIEFELRHEFVEDECPYCGSTETTELVDDGPPEQSITICAGCGAD
jgi:hypothetical protein